MNKIGFLSTNITNSIYRYLPEFDCSGFDINTLAQTLTSKVDVDYLVVLLDLNYFSINGFLDKNSFNKLEELKSLLKIFRSKNTAKVIISNISGIFLDINTSLNLSQHQKLIDLNKAIDELSNITDITVINLYQLSNYYGFKNFYNLKSKFIFQAPWTKIAVIAIAKAITEKISLFNLVRKKVLILDADNTLWGGVVGEAGLNGIDVDENYPGIIYSFFQQQLKFLKDSGILLALVSKNNFLDVEDVFKKKNMPLKWDDFVTKKINWSPKSQNISEISDELNIGLESLVFIDDSDFELAEVKGLLGVECVKISIENPIENLNIFDNLISIKTLNITLEDKGKTNQYLEESLRKFNQKSFSSIDDYLASINMKIFLSLNDISQIKRITQLINKTNQFNSTLIRYNESEVLKLMESQNIFSFSLTDNFGDLGIISVVILNDTNIDLFLISCRALGRNIEEKILYLISNFCNEEFTANYVKTSKNHQVESFFDRLSIKNELILSKSKKYIFSKDIDDINYIEEII